METKKPVTIREQVLSNLMIEWHAKYSPTEMWTEEEKAEWGKITIALNNALNASEQFDPNTLTGIIAEYTTQLRDLGVKVVEAFAMRNNIKTMQTIIRRMRVENIGEAIFKNSENAYIADIVKNGRFIRVRKPSTKKK